MLQDLEVYRLQVRHSVETDSEEPFKNRSAAHACIVAEEFLGSAKNTVDIFCGCLAEDVYGGDDMYEVFHNIMRHRGVTVRIVTAGPTCAAARLADFIRRHGGQIRHLAEDVRQELADAYHFFVVDNKRYRIEPQGENRTALACANGVKEGMIANLSRLFNVLFELAEPEPEQAPENHG